VAVDMLVKLSRPTRNCALPKAARDWRSKGFQRERCGHCDELFILLTEKIKGGGEISFWVNDREYTEACKRATGAS
jgi:hypothetical protein